jgi:hypothetical protein
MSDDTPKAASTKTAQAATPDAPDAVPTTVPIELTLNQFGIELSQRDNRMELVNAFVFLERQEGNHKDTEAGYQARFEAFLNKPV